MSTVGNDVHAGGSSGLYPAGLVGAGLIAGGAGGYLSTSAIKNDAVTDSFVKHIGDGTKLGDAKGAFEKAIKEKSKKTIDYLKGLAAQKVKKGKPFALNKKVKDIVKDLKGLGFDGEAVAKELEAVKDAKSLKAFKEAATAAAKDNAAKNVINGLVSKDTGKFVSKGANKAIGEALNGQIGKFKMWGAAKWAAIGAVAAGVIAYLTSGSKKDVA